MHLSLRWTSHSKGCRIESFLHPTMFIPSFLNFPAESASFQHRPTNFPVSIKRAQASAISSGRISLQQKHFRWPGSPRRWAAVLNAVRNLWAPSLAKPPAKPSSPESHYPACGHQLMWRGSGCCGDHPSPSVSQELLFWIWVLIVGYGLSFQPSYGS